MDTAHLDENEQIKEVYAQFGLAVYEAQCVERQLTILLTTVHGPGLGSVTRTQYDSLLEGEFKKTLGALVLTLRRAAVIDADFDQKLESCLRQRNWLIHNYFWERAGHFMTEKGRQFMIEELQEATNMLLQLDTMLTAIVRAWADLMGMDPKVFEMEQSKLIEDANSSF